MTSARERVPDPFLLGSFLPPLRHAGVLYGEAHGLVKGG